MNTWLPQNLGYTLKSAWSCNVVILQYKRLQVLEFITHLNAYKVLELDEMACVKQKDLKDFHPLSLCKGFGQFAQGCFVVLRYSVYCV